MNFYALIKIKISKYQGKIYLNIYREYKFIGNKCSIIWFSNSAVRNIKTVEKENKFVRNLQRSHTLREPDER